MCFCLAIIGAIHVAIVVLAVIVFVLLAVLAYLARVPFVRPGLLEGEQGAIYSVYRQVASVDHGELVSAVALALLIALGTLFVLVVVEIRRGEVVREVHRYEGQDSEKKPLLN